jgi:general secretion pathway protein E
LAEQEELRRAGGAQTEGTRLGEILLRRRAVTEEQVLRALGHQFGLDVLLEIKPDTIDQDLVQRIPINFAKQHSVLLLRRNKDDDTVEAAIADPTAVHILDDIGSSGRCRGIAIFGARVADHRGHQQGLLTSWY